MGRINHVFRRMCNVVATPFVQVGFLGKVLDVFYQEYQFNKIVATQRNVHRKLKNNFEDAKVKYGPFQGLKYPELAGFGSELYPKLLGCYEVELFDWVERIRPNNYDKIVNIGCAEGYYAVGLGLMFENARVYAYDLAERARELCTAMAKVNGIADRMNVFSKCTANTLNKLDFGERSLIVCDCEGFEMELFKSEVMDNIKNCDILIELHDFINPDISNKMLPLFEETHNLVIYRSMDDELKIIQLSEKYKELQKLTHFEKKIALGELRPTTMEWAFLTPKKAFSISVPRRTEMERNLIEKVG